ncbi:MULTISPECIES: lytic polysaccharide monooxygenase [unclassified Enterococcus]|uniref:lytic polysaccharide monooxygenase n=1 Tax=unclassified Enterococcus TaxID=2608891 RepID=UPI0013E9D33B|nr:MULTISPECIES: lytic polysaccharide monooxygenase [unclassified Enterococcus]
MKKSTLLGLGLIFATTGFTALSSVDAFAHGYVEQPASRGYKGSLEKDSNWNAAFEKYGLVINEPQSLEAPKGFPSAGPADGRIASANGAVGDFVLDKQTDSMWKKSTISTGSNTFKWTFTAAHSTAKWHYYMTKNGWNPNKPISRNELQLIGEVNYGGKTPPTSITNTVNVPSDRLGYHVILAVWDVADTNNAFYNVIDVNVQNRNVLTDLEIK